MFDSLFKTENSNEKEVTIEHCFPDIKSEQFAAEAGDEGGGDDGFRRIVFGDSAHSLSGDRLNQFTAEEGECSEGEYFNKNEISDLKKEAYSKGFEEGKKIGVESEKKIVASLLDDFRGAVAGLEEFKENLCRDAEKSAFKFAFCLAEKILRVEVEKKNNAVLKIIKEALKKIMDDESVTIKINPSDLSYLENSGFLQSGDIVAGENVKFEADPEISRGGCLVEADSGLIDARIESQLSVIKQSFSEEFF